MTIKGEIVTKYLEKFPDARKSTLANKIYKENKEVFKSAENVRSIIRQYTGACGTNGKNYAKGKFVEPFVKVNGFKKMPKGLTTISNWKTVRITGSHKVLVLGDAHIPFHDRDALELAVEHGYNFGPDTIILNGDWADHYAQSRWQTDPRLRNFKKELDTVLLSFEWLRELFPKARIIYKLGNHEERYENYMELKAPELLGINKFDFSTVFELDKFGIELVNDKKPIKLNELFIIHGHEYRSAFFNPVNPARGLFLRAKVNALCGHYHQSSAHSENDLDQKSTGCWSLGHLADPHPKYMPLNKWNHGFAEIETHGNRQFQVANYKIIDKEIFRA